MTKCKKSLSLMRTKNNRNSHAQQCSHFSCPIRLNFCSVHNSFAQHFFTAATLLSIVTSHQKQLIFFIVDSEVIPLLNWCFLISLWIVCSIVDWHQLILLRSTVFTRNKWFCWSSMPFHSSVLVLGKRRCYQSSLVVLSCVAHWMQRESLIEIVHCRFNFTLMDQMTPLEPSLATMSLLTVLVHQLSLSKLTMIVVWAFKVSTFSTMLCQWFYETLYSNGVRASWIAKL